MLSYHITKEVLCILFVMTNNDLMVYFHVDTVALKLLHIKYTDVGISSHL